MSSYPVSDIAGVNADLVGKLASVGIRTTQKLIASVERDNGRSLAVACAVPETTVWALFSASEMMLVKGVGSDYLSLLWAAGVTNLDHLAAGKPAVLVKLLQRVNLEHKRVRQVPTYQQIAGWVVQAKALRKMRKKR